VRAHPGRFTYVAPPDFTGSAFIRHVLLHFGDGTATFEKFDEPHYARASAKALSYLKEIRPFLWRRGETYPATTRELDRLFANGEVDYSMSYAPAFASVRIDRGEFPATTRTFVFDEGTLANYNFLAIPFNTSNLSGALVVINHLMSFDQLLDLSRALRSPFPLELSTRSASQQASVAALPRGVATLSDAELSSHALAEPHAEYLLRFEKDWQAKVLRE
jgi:putative spermidine/putrescine transport system substrate-binding protein